MPFALAKSDASMKLMSVGSTRTRSYRVNLTLCRVRDSNTVFTGGRLGIGLAWCLVRYLTRVLSVKTPTFLALSAAMSAPTSWVTPGPYLGSVNLAAQCTAGWCSLGCQYWRLATQPRSIT